LNWWVLREDSNNAQHVSLPGALFRQFQEKGFRRRGSDAFVANLFLAGGLRRQFLFVQLP
jgi:hypothetical protein